MGLFCVYKHTSPNGKVYIGITSRKPEYRWRHGKGYSQNSYFENAINSYGWENFKHEILFENLTKQEACEKEKQLILQYSSNNRIFGYNLSTGGENSAEGSKWSDETRRKMSAVRKGHIVTEKTKAAISKAKKGKPNGREGALGKRCPKAGVLSQIDEQTGSVIATFYGYNEMSRQTGYASTPVKEAVSGKRKRAYGYVWKYAKRGNTNVFI